MEIEVSTFGLSVVAMWVFQNKDAILPLMTISYPQWDFLSYQYRNKSILWQAYLHSRISCTVMKVHDDVIKWKHFPRYWLFVWGIHWSPVNSTHKGQWRGALILSLICVWTNAWVNNRDAGDLRPNCAHHDVIVMFLCYQWRKFLSTWWHFGFNDQFFSVKLNIS